MVSNLSFSMLSTANCAAGNFLDWFETWRSAVVGGVDMDVDVEVNPREEIDRLYAEGIMLYTL